MYFFFIEYNRANSSPSQRGYSSNTSTPQSASSGGSGIANVIPAANSNGSNSLSVIGSNSSISGSDANGSGNLSISSGSLGSPGLVTPQSISTPQLKYESMHSYHPANVPSPNLVRTSNPSNAYAISASNNMPSAPGIFNGMSYPTYPTQYWY